MANTPYELNDEVIDKMVANLQVGIAKVESSKDGYSAHNTQHSDPQMQALGKYQFVPKYWWKDISEFAKKNGYEDIKTHADFLKSPSLQDSYFRHYVKNDILPMAMETYSQGKNPDNLTLEEMAVFYHFQSPKVAKKAITMGEEGYREATKKGVNGSKVSNISMKDYKTKYNEALKDSNLKPLSIAETTDTRTKEKIGEDYFNAKDNIIHSSKDLSKGEINKRIEELNTKYKAAGHIDIVNEYVEQRNIENKKTASEKDAVLKDSMEKFLDYTPEMDIFYNQKGDRKKATGSASISFGTNKEASEFREFAKANGIKVESGRNNIFQVDTKTYWGALEGKYKDLTGKTITAKSEVADFDDDSNFMAKLFGNKNNRTGGYQFQQEFLNEINGATSFTEVKKLDPNLIPDPITVPYSVEGSAEGSAEVAKVENKKPITPEADGQTVESNTEGSAADDYFQTELGLLGVNDGMSVPAESKRELPIDAITGMALGLIGNEQAKNANVPLRTEEVSQAVKQFTSELAKRSKEGLPVEVEAAMNAQLAEAYQGGLQSIVNSSAGNRATVLGNQGQLETAKNRGLVDIQLADYEAKERAFQQYGEAIKYKNDFDTRRDIANHSIRYQEGQKKQQEGKDLATAGFSQLVEGIRYQKENGPGSANSMYEAHLMQKMFGFNPKAKDDGTGNTPGTKSWYEKGKSKEKERLGLTLDYSEKLNSLNPEQKKMTDTFFKNNTSEKSRFAFIDYLKDNPQADPKKMTMDNIDLAVKNNNFGLLSTSREEAITPTVAAVNEIKLSGRIPSLATPPIQTAGLLGQPSVKPEPQLAEEQAPGFGETFEIDALKNLANLNYKI